MATWMIIVLIVAGLILLITVLYFTFKAPTPAPSVPPVTSSNTPPSNPNLNLSGGQLAGDIAGIAKLL